MRNGIIIPPYSGRGNLCMLGGIYSRQKCPICGGTFRDDGRKALTCPRHPDQRASQFAVVFKGIYRRFHDYDDAYRFLSGVRFKTDEGSFDRRDYQKDEPLGLANLSENWLKIKQETVRPKSYNNLDNYMARAGKYFGNRNIKTIGYAEIEDFLLAQKVSDKTRSNMKSCLHDFWQWLRKRRVITLAEMPEFPEVPFELGFRATIAKDVQEAILDEIHRISYTVNPKIWLGIRWLCTYVSIRPGELISLTEGNIDLGNGYLFIPHPKEKKPKLVPLLEEDVEIIRTFPRGVPALPFFRHVAGISGTRENEPFGARYLYKWWQKACSNLGVEGVDLYGGTRHSSAKALRHFCSPEEIKRATMHSTNKAFERYFQMESDDLRTIYGKTRGAKKALKNFSASQNDNILKYKE